MLRMTGMRALMAILLFILATPAFAQANARRPVPPPAVSVSEPSRPPAVIDNEQPIPVPVPPPQAATASPANIAATSATDLRSWRAAEGLPQATPEMKYRSAYYEHLDRMNQITEGKFVWQDRASEVTLWLVVFIVVSGVGLSFFQIWIAFHQGGKVGDTSIEASAQNFRVTSSVVGIIILLISTGFLYLFLQHVYEIKVVDLRAPADQRSEPAKPKTAADFGLPPPDSAPPPARSSAPNP